MTPALEIKDITLAYGRRTLLANVSVKFTPGRLTAILGRNGAGKSTLMRAISGLGKPAAGEISVGGRNVCTLDSGETARLVSFVGTEKVRIPNLRCEDLVALGRAPYTNWIGQTTAEDREIIHHSLRLTGMEDYADRTMDSMSDGECQRIMIARALAQDTPIMLLDEPTAFLDLPGKYATVSLLHSLAAESGKTVLFSTHDLDIALEESDDILLFDPPGVIFRTSAEMASCGDIGRVFGIDKFKKQ